MDLSSAQLERLRGALAPVYRRLERAPGTLQAIRAIEALSRKTPAARPIRCEGASSSSGGAPTPIDGTWQMTVNQGDLLGNPAYGHSVTAADVELDIGTYRFVFHDGQVRQSVRGPAVGTPPTDTGTYRVDGDLVTIHITGGHDAGETWSYRWSVYRGQLTFRKPPATLPQGPPNPMFAPWHRSGA